MSGKQRLYDVPSSTIKVTSLPSVLDVKLVSILMNFFTTSSIYYVSLESHLFRGQQYRHKGHVIIFPAPSGWPGCLFPWTRELKMRAAVGGYIKHLIKQLSLMFWYVRTVHLLSLKYSRNSIWIWFSFLTGNFKYSCCLSASWARKAVVYWCSQAVPNQSPGLRM